MINNFKTSRKVSKKPTQRELQVQIMFLQQEIAEEDKKQRIRQHKVECLQKSFKDFDMRPDVPNCVSFSDKHFQKLMDDYIKEQQEEEVQEPEQDNQSSESDDNQSISPLSSVSDNCFFEMENPSLILDDSLFY